MTWTGRLCGLASVAVAAVIVLAGCGETVIDNVKISEQLTSTREKETGKTVSSVDCPSDVEVKAGKTFTCTIKMKGGEEEVATLKIRDEDANLSLVSVKPAAKSK